jgi:SAM-dependent methyltransferase
MPEIRTVEEFYEHTDTAIPVIDTRLRIFVDEYRRYRDAAGRTLQILDVGCGRKALLGTQVDPADEYCACDIAPPEVDGLQCFEQVNLNEASLRDVFPGREFDVIFCGEVIEHLFSPDALLADLKRLLRRDGLLILSTPNLAYWANRILLPLGVSPLFLENSAVAKLGRRFRLFGQGNQTEGHIRLFTYKAARDLLQLQGFELLRTRSAPVWDFAIDRLICRLSPSLSPDNIYVARPGS